MRDADRMTADDARRTITRRWFLDQEPIDRGRPCLVLECRHDRQRGTLSATVSYCEHEQAQGYAFDRWQSDWLFLRIDSEPIARYSRGQLDRFAARALERLADPEGPEVLRGLAALIDGPKLVPVSS